jgi:two-component system nitrogen regulation response regulator GlnG
MSTSFMLFALSGAASHGGPHGYFCKHRANLNPPVFLSATPVSYVKPTVVDTATLLIYIAFFTFLQPPAPMPHSEFTLTSPVSAGSGAERPLLCLTIAWHPELQRIGQQCLVTATGGLALSRFLPLFRAPDKEGAALLYGGISRAPLQLSQDAEGNVTITPPDSRMVTELNGVPIDGPATLSAAQIGAGAILGLGRAVLLCLHWMGCLPQANAVDGWIGVGQAAIRVRALIRQVAATDATVLLLGETGTGKEVAARAIHQLSQRAQARLVSVNMAALNESLAAADLFGAAKGAYTGAQSAREGWFAEAEGSTLFLDEIGNTPATVQPMLLRVLETGEYRPLGAARDRSASARLIAATDQDLYGGSFNLALLRRLESFIIPLPALRARREDIGLLIAHALQEAHAEGLAAQLPVALVQQLLLYDWPGNVRQLKHVLKRILLGLRMGDTPGFADLVDRAGTHLPASPAAAQPLAKPRKTLADISAQDVLQAMDEHQWYIQGAAQALGISRPSMYKLLDAHPHIRRPDQIEPDEIQRALAACNGDIEDCAARLRTPAEALRRLVRSWPGPA